MTTTDSRTPARHVPAAIGAAMTTVQPALRAAVHRHLSPEMGRVVRYHHGWTDADGRPADAWSGKLLRPSLALLSARAAGGTGDDGIPAAVAIELVHNFSLLHDDIMDGDTARRGRATAWTLFGVPQAILAGDALCAAATSVLLEADGPGARPAVAALTAATQRMISGQALDVAFERRRDVTLDECLGMAADKTAALLACACALGAHLIGAGPELTVPLTAFGEHVGLAFQLVDDLLGIWGDPHITGKEAGADLRAGKKSLPVVAALNATDPGELAACYPSAAPMTEPEVRRVATLIERAGGRAWAEEEATRQIAAAAAVLATAPIPAPIHDDLREITTFLTGRAF